jgi:hypothetical protein
MAYCHGMNSYSEATASKHDVLRRFLKMRLPHWKRSARHLVFVEPTPGIGFHEKEQADGSPLILNRFLRDEWDGPGRTSRYVACDDGYKIWSCGSRDRVVDLLATTLALHGHDHSGCCFGNARTELARLAHQWRGQRGLLFVDPCGRFPFEAVVRAVDGAPGVDVLMNLPAHQTIRHCTRNEVGEMVEATKDRAWFITMWEGAQQWVRMLGTTDLGFDGLPLGMFRVDQQFGADIFRRMFDRKYNHQTRSEISRKGAAARRMDGGKVAGKVAALVRKGLSYSAIAKLVGVHSATVSKIARGCR